MHGMDGAASPAGGAPSLKHLSALFGEDLLPFVSGKRCGSTTARVVRVRERKPPHKAAQPTAGVAQVAGTAAPGAPPAKLYDVEFECGLRERGVEESALLEGGGGGGGRGGGRGAVAVEENAQVNLMPTALSEPFLHMAL